MKRFRAMRSIGVLVYRCLVWSGLNDRMSLVSGGVGAGRGEHRARFHTAPFRHQDAVDQTQQEGRIPPALPQSGERFVVLSYRQRAQPRKCALSIYSSYIY